MHATKPKMAKKWEKEKKDESADRDYKDEYKKFQSSDKSKKYRAELNKYNRDKGTYGNGDGKDASHKGGKIVGFEKESKNRGRAEKSRLKKESPDFNPMIDTILDDVIKEYQTTNEKVLKKNPGEFVDAKFSKAIDNLPNSKLTKDLVIKLAKKYKVDQDDALRFVSYGYLRDFGLKESVHEGKFGKFDTGAAFKGNGLTIYDRNQSQGGDFKNIAHISEDGKITIWDKNIKKETKLMQALKKISNGFKASFKESVNEFKEVSIKDAFKDLVKSQGKKKALDTLTSVLSGGVDMTPDVKKKFQKKLLKKLSESNFMEYKLKMPINEGAFGKYDTGAAFKGNGMTIYDRNQSQGGDYKNIAHISEDGKLTIWDKNIKKEPKLMQSLKKISQEFKTSFKESVNEGGMGILDKDQTDVLHGIVMKNKNKNSKAILSIVMKDRMFSGVDKKELLGYIEGAKQFVRYMGRTGNESVNEGKNIGHYERVGNQTIVDSNFVNYSKGVLPNSELVHLGMGDFAVKSPKGTIEFRRSGKLNGIGQDFVGRPHRMIDDKNGKLVDAFLKLMLKKKKAILSMSESVVNERQFKGLDGIDDKTPLTKISDTQKLKIIQGTGNIISFFVPKGFNRNFWQVISKGKIKKGKSLSGKVVYTLPGKMIGSPQFKSIKDLIKGVDWVEVEEARRFNESVNEAKYKGYDWKRQNRKDGHPLIVPALQKTFANMKDLKKYIDKHGTMESVNEKISKEEWAQYPAYARKLKPYMQKLLKVPLKVRVIKQANHNPWIEVRVAKFGKDIIPNDFRVKVAKSIGASAVRDWDDVTYGTIRSNSIDLRYEQWVKIIGDLK